MSLSRSAIGKAGGAAPASPNGSPHPSYEPTLLADPFDVAVAPQQSATGSGDLVSLRETTEAPTVAELDVARERFHGGPAATELTDRARRIARGRTAGQWAGNVATTSLGLRSAPVKAVGESLAAGTGYLVEVSDKARARVGSRRGRIAAAVDRFAASGAAAKELRSAGGVNKHAKRVIRNAAKLDRRTAAKNIHHDTGGKLAHEHKLAEAALHYGGVVVEGAKARWSNWRLGLAEDRLADRSQKFDERNAVVEARLERGRSRVARGDDRRQANRLDALSEVDETFGRLGRRDVIRDVAKRRAAAEQVIADRRAVRHV